MTPMMLLLYHDPVCLFYWYVTSELVPNLWREFVLTRTKDGATNKKCREQKARSKSKHHHCTDPNDHYTARNENADSNERSATISRHHGGRRRTMQRRIIISQCQQQQRGVDLLLQHAMAIDAKALWEYKVQQGECALLRLMNILSWFLCSIYPLSLINLSSLIINILLLCTVEGGQARWLHRPPSQRTIIQNHCQCTHHHHHHEATATRSIHSIICSSTATATTTS